MFTKTLMGILECNKQTAIKVEAKMIELCPLRMLENLPGTEFRELAWAALSESSR